MFVSRQNCLLLTLLLTLCCAITNTKIQGIMLALQMEGINATTTGCSGIIVFFFHNSLQPLHRLHRSKNYLQSSQRNASVQLFLFACNFFCTTYSSRLVARERWQTLESSWKNNLFNEHPVVHGRTEEGTTTVLRPLLGHFVFTIGVYFNKFSPTL